MELKEKIELLEMLHKLPERKQWEIYFMVKGAALVAERNAYVSIKNWKIWLAISADIVSHVTVSKQYIFMVKE